MTSAKHYALFLLLTPIFFITSIWISVFPHEYAHSTTAWLLGYKANPLALYYGHLNWQNVLFVSGIDENVNYFLMYLLGDRSYIGLAAFAGPGIVTLGIYLFSLFLLHQKSIQARPFLFYFIFWCNLVNLSELVSYIYLRTFTTHGDIGHIIFSWHLSPWLVFIVCGTLLFFALWHFYTHTLIALYAYLHLDALAAKLLMLIIVSYIIFGASGIRMFLDPYGEVATVLGMGCFLVMPLLIIVCWPGLPWVKRKLRLMTL